MAESGNSSKSYTDKYIEIQKNIRNDTEEYKNILNDLYNWETEMKSQEKQKSTSANTTTTTNENNMNCEKTPLIRTAKHQTSTIKEQNADGDLKNDFTVKSSSSSSSAKSTELLEKTLNNNMESSRKEANNCKEKGNYHVKLGEYDKATEYYTNAIKHYENDPIYFANRALCYLKLERYENCIQDCNLAIKLNSKYTKAYYRRAQAYESLGYILDAFKDCSIIHELEPGNKESNSLYMRLSHKLNSKLTDKEFEEVNILEKTKNFDDLPKNVVAIETIIKPAHLRSKAPVKRIQIVQKIDNYDDEDEKQSKSKVVVVDSKKSNKNVENLSIVSNRTTSSSKVLINDISDLKTEKDNFQKSHDKISNDATTTAVKNMKILNLKAPDSTGEFYSTWKELSKEQKYIYLKIIKPEKINKVLGPCLNSDILSDIISVLSSHFIDNQEDIIGKLLYNISQNDEIKILSCFLSENDQQGLLKLIDYMHKQQINTEFIQTIKNNFLL